MSETANWLRRCDDGHDSAWRVHHRQGVEQRVRQEGNGKRRPALQVAGVFGPPGTSFADQHFFDAAVILLVGLDQVHAVEQHAAALAPLTTALREFQECFVMGIVACGDPSHDSPSRATGAKLRRCCGLAPCSRSACR
jgi:hypothetical protein